MMNRRGQISVQDLFAVVILIFVFFVVNQVIIPLYALMLPSIANSYTTGPYIILMFNLIPLVMVMLILVYPFLSSQVRRQGGYGGGFGA